MMSMRVFRAQITLEMHSKYVLNHMGLSSIPENVTTWIWMSIPVINNLRTTNPSAVRDNRLDSDYSSQIEFRVGHCQAKKLFIIVTIQWWLPRPPALFFCFRFRERAQLPQINSNCEMATFIFAANPWVYILDKTLSVRILPYAR